MSDVVAKLWGFCHTLRHDGVDYGDYIEQLTYLLFLKMADEKDIDLTKITWTDEKGKHATDCSWPTLGGKSGTSLTDHYAEVLRILSRQPGLLGEIFVQATPRLSNPVNLKRLLVMIDEEDWSAMDVDVKGAAFEGLLEKAASEGKKGAGQYFTPRRVIESICRVMKPDPRGHKEYRIMDPACGTGGFLVNSYEWLIGESKGTFDRADIKRIKTSTYYGQELVARPRRLALMNMYLHGVEPHIYPGDTIYEPDRGERYDIVLTNPPFGTKGANQAPEREDFTIETSNKQLNFVQHVVNILKPGGRAAIVLPDNCLFEDKAGEVFEIVMQDCRVHTILRLPRGTFTPYSQGVKANVIFLQKGEPTTEVWIYDARSNVPGITKKDRPLTREHFTEFEKCYGSDPNGRAKRRDLGDEGRFRRFPLGAIKDRNFKLDLTWLKDDALDDNGDIPEPQDLATEAITELEAVVDDLKEIIDLLERGRREMNDELPKGWTATSTKDLLAYVTSGSRGWARYYSADGALFLRISNLDHGTISIDLSDKRHVRPPASSEGTRTRVQVGDLLVSITADVGMVGLVQEEIGEAYINQHIALARPVEGIDREYLAWFIASTDGQAQLRELQRGATKVGLGLDDIKAVDVPFPPLNEQRRIVAKIELLLSKVRSCQERLDRIPKILKRFRRAVLTAACTGQLTASYRRSRVDEPWQERSLGEVVIAIEAGRSFTCEERPPTGNEVGVLKISAVTWGTFDENESKTCMDPALVNMEYLVHAGDLLMTRANTIELVGAVALVERVSKKLMLSDKTLRIQVGGAVSPRWVLYWLRSELGREQIESLATGNQQSMRNISQGSIRAIKIRVPPLEEQKKIESAVEALMGVADQIETRYKIAHARVDRLTESVLAKAFRGELVPTESELARSEGREFESAAQLLDRIANARTKPVETSRVKRHAPITRRSGTRALP